MRHQWIIATTLVLDRSNQGLPFRSLYRTLTLVRESRRSLRSKETFMATIRRRLKLLGIAFLAVIGIVSAGDSANACSRVGAPKPMACCELNPAPNCDCCDKIEVIGGVAPQWSLSVEPLRIELASPTNSCECRPDAPSTPASTPAPSSFGDPRSDQVFDEVDLDFGNVARLPARLIRTLLSDDFAAKTPLYLRTLHILV